MGKVVAGRLSATPKKELNGQDDREQTKKTS
jgi:hypothetical protein